MRCLGLHQDSDDAEAGDAFAPKIIRGDRPDLPPKVYPSSRNGDDWDDLALGRSPGIGRKCIGSFSAWEFPAHRKDGEGPPSEIRPRPTAAHFTAGRNQIPAWRLSTGNVASAASGGCGAARQRAHPRARVLKKSHRAFRQGCAQGCNQQADTSHSAP